MTEKIGCVQHDCAECKARLAQPEVCKANQQCLSGLPCVCQPERPWVGLTDAEINAAAACQSWKPFAQAIEAKLKEKNAL